MPKKSENATAVQVRDEHNVEKLDKNVNVEQVGKETHKDYDEVPYESHLYPFSSPANLYTLATLFKIGAPDIKTAKVLELGCASGGNLLPHAMRYPNAEFVGVDLSKRQIEEGQKHIEQLGLKNLTLKHMSIENIGKNFGQFDYIIVHGVYSWVPEAVQDKILAVCRDHLTANGIAYISYNTLPGWNMVKTIRDMMLYHTNGFSTLSEKAKQARLLLNFVKESFGKEGNSPYVKLVEEESAILAQQGDYYLIHDHLNRDNTPCYFYEFMDKAKQNQLNYVSDVDISQMYLGSMPANVQTVLASIQNDIVRTEQYLDFIGNRRFRMSILCKNNVVANRALNPEDIKNFYFRTRAVKKEDNSYQLSALKTLNINTAGNPVAHAMCELLLAQEGRNIKVSELVKKTHTVLGAKQNKNDTNSVVYKNLLELAIRGGGFLGSEPDEYIATISERPKAYELARHQVSSQIWVTNKRYEKVMTDLFCRLCLKYCDGTRTVPEIRKEILKHIEKGDINLNQNGVKVEKKKDIEMLLDTLLSNAMNALVRGALLEA